MQTLETFGLKNPVQKKEELLGYCKICGGTITKKENGNGHINGYNFGKSFLCDDCLDEAANARGYGNCDGCDERIPEERMFNEGYY